MISETIIKAAEIEKAVEIMMKQFLDNITLAMSMPPGSIVSMRNGDLVIVTETPDAVPPKLEVGFYDDFCNLTQAEKDQWLKHPSMAPALKL